MAQHQHEATSGALGRTALWRKSSYSGDQGNCVEVAVLTTARWHKSTCSGSEGNCIEVSHSLPGAVAVRDSKSPSGPALVFTHDEWTAFLARMRPEF